MIPYDATTRGVTVTVRPVYLDDPSDFFEKRFVFAYFISIENHTDTPVQLLRRYWRIEEIDGSVREVEGAGVIGQQPIIKPGHAHIYSSYCILSSLSGAMEGYYLMRTAEGQRFRVAIPRFDLHVAAN